MTTDIAKGVSSKVYSFEVSVQVIRKTRNAAMRRNQVFNASTKYSYVRDSGTGVVPGQHNN